ncbi:MAG: ParB N-terminal domain-containing protein [Firmicutes bacterium]|nr:ParB N-terminal domain-containing protein [Bacillota bacterium]
MEFHPYTDLFPAMTEQEFEGLKEDIKANGLLEPIVVFEGKILDGRHRYMACVQLGLQPRFLPLPNDVDPLDYVVAVNLHRRHLTSSQRAAIAVQFLDFERIEAKKRQGTRTDLMSKANFSAKIPESEFSESEWGEAREKAAAKVKASPRYVQEAANLKKQNPEMFEAVKRGEKTITQAKRELKKQKTKEDAETWAKGGALPRDVRIIEGDFREVGATILDASVDLIFTDPPYDEKSIQLYGDLAKFAARVLKPGGSLLVYAGHYALPRIFDVMKNHLRYWWIIAVEHSGGNARLPGKWVYVHWKPILWFVKENYKGKDFVADLIRSTPPEKDLHDWQQSTAEAEYYISRLTEQSGLVLDPFCGSGTTGIAAIRLARRFVGIEKDPATVTRAKGILLKELEAS